MADAAERLDDAQKWAVAMLVVKLIAGATALLGTAGFFAVTQVARETAEKVAEREAAAKAELVARNVSEGAVAQRLQMTAEFVAAVRTGITDLPVGAVLPVVGDNCPTQGWRRFDQPGRVIMVASRPDTGDQTFAARRTGGARTITLQRENLPPHAHHLIVPVASPPQPLARTGNGLGGATVGEYAYGGYHGRLTHDGGHEFLSTPMEILPPFIALVFCERVGAP